MTTSRGGAAVRAFMAELPAKLQNNILRGAGRAGASVIAEEAKERVTSDATRENITITAKTDGSRIVAKIGVKPGWGRSIGIWLEYGTLPHIIRASAAARGGRSIGRINRLAAEGGSGSGRSLVIGGRFVGEVVHHPGAKQHPFLRVSLDLKAGEAVAAAQGYINARVLRGGIGGDGDGGDEV